MDAELGAYLLPLIHDKEQRWEGEERAWLVIMPALSVRVLPASLSTVCTAAGHFWLAYGAQPSLLSWALVRIQVEMLLLVYLCSASLFFCCREYMQWLEEVQRFVQ